jgi:hypothetical protein
MQYVDHRMEDLHSRLGTQNGNFMQHMDDRINELHSKLEECLRSQDDGKAGQEPLVVESEANLGALYVDNLTPRRHMKRCNSW